MTRVAGIDLAFRRNSCGLAIGDPAPVPRVPRRTILFVREWQPTGSALVPSATCAEIAAECERWGVTIAAADGHYIETLREAMDAVHIALVDAPSRPSDAWLPMQEDVIEDEIDIIEHERLRLQMQAVKFTYESGGLVKVHQDVASDGSHGDIASAVVLADWLMREGADTGRILGGRVQRTEFSRAHRTRIG